MNLSQIAATLREIRVSPVKSLGQNFLHDQNVARWIVEQAQISAGDDVVEIGPGLGALTEMAIAKGARVLALEKDARLAQFLKAHLPTEALEVRHEDAIDFDVRTLFAKPQVKLIGNLPYYISSQLLLRFLQWPSPISLSVLMLQKEMATRLSATPGSKDYGALTLQVQLHYRVEYLRTIASSVFIPRPDIDSAVVRLVPRSPSELAPRDDETFRRIVRLGFSQRRKQLRNLLSEQVPEWDTAAEQLGLDAALVLQFDRAFSLLSPEDFLRRILIERLHVSAILVGANFCFGHRGAGNVRLLEQFGKEHDFDVETVPPVEVEGIVVSSTAVRNAIVEGRVGDVIPLLGHPFSLTGEIRSGAGRGRTILFPTLNLAPEQELLPKLGVYATESVVGGKTFPSVTNVGTRPTFDGRDVTVESYLFGFSEQISGGPMEVRFRTRLRDERKFSGAEELREQIARDILAAREYFSPRDAG